MAAFCRDSLLNAVSMLCSYLPPAPTSAVPHLSLGSTFHFLSVSLPGTSDTERSHFLSYGVKIKSKKENQAGRWGCTPLIPALGRQRHKQADLYGFKARLIFIDSSRPARTTGTLLQNKQASKQTANCHLRRDTNMVKLNKEADNTFDLLRAGCYPRFIYINFFGSFLPNLHIEQQNKRSRVCVSEFSICVWELKGLSRTCPRSQKFSIWLPCPRHVPVYYSTFASHSEGDSSHNPGQGSMDCTSLSCIINFSPFPIISTIM